MPVCRVCGEDLNDDTWAPSRKSRNEHLCMDCDHEDQNTRFYNLREEAIEAYGGKCECCGTTYHEFLTFDHISGKGAEHRRKLGMSGSYKFYAWLKRMGWPKDDYQLLCWSCNMAKYIYGHCPHKRDTPELRGEVGRNDPKPEVPFRIE